MGLFGKIMDNFKAADFDIHHNMKVKTLQSEFKKNFGLTLSSISQFKSQMQITLNF